MNSLRNVELPPWYGQRLIRKGCFSFNINFTIKDRIHFYFGFSFYLIVKKYFPFILIIWQNEPYKNNKNKQTLKTSC